MRDPFPTEGAETMTRDVIERLAKVGALRRRGPTARVNDTDWDVAEALFTEVVAPLLAEAERRGAERAWDDALDLAGDESFDVRGKLCGESDWARVEDLFWDHLGEMQKANPYRAGDDQ